MQPSERELWRRLEAFSLDDPAAAFSFTARLARENGWGIAFAARVVDEYKRFVFLAMTAGHEVTPSDEVDQAWHLHLTYTRSYWGELCNGVLGRPLHHGPTKGGAAEGRRYERQYGETLASYRRAFGTPPPADIWPPSETRFGEAPDFVRVNRQRVWLLPKPWRAADRRPYAFAGAWLAITPPLAAAATLNPLDFDGPTFLGFFACTAALALVGAVFCRLALRAPEPPGGAGRVDEQDAAEIAALRDGWQGALHAELARLLKSKAIVLEKKGGLFSSKACFLAKRDAQDGDSEIARAMLRSMIAGAGHGVDFSDLGMAARPHAEQVSERLARLGLVETRASLLPARIAAALILGLVALLGLAKVFVGLGRDKPVGFLVMGLVVFGVVGLAVLNWTPKRTRAGELELRRLLQKNGGLKQRAKSIDERLSAEDIAMMVGLYGLGSADIPFVADLRKAAKSSPASSGGTGCGGDGGSGCGGGGCGGCGGCS